MPRAPRLTPPERRTALIEATIPLLLQHGTSVSTRQIAEAAGVAEGTIFRVFDTKEDLLHATATHVLTRDGFASSLATLPPDADLHTTVTQIAQRLAARMSDAHAMIAILHAGRVRPAPGHDPHHGPPLAPEASSTCQRPDPRTAQARLVQTVADALAPHADALRTTVDHAAAALVALTFASHHAGPAPGLDTTAIADVLLHGVAARPTQGDS